MTDYKVPLTELVAADYNPRQHGEKPLAALAESIRHFTKTLEGWDPAQGWRMASTITVNRQGNRIVGGHMRVKALKALGQDWLHADDITWVDIPPDSPTERALNLSLNNPRNQGAFAVDAIEMLRDLKIELPDMSAELDLGGLLGDLEFALLGPGPPAGAGEWEGMPEFQQEDLTSWKRLIVHFATEADMKAFAALVKQTLTSKTQWIWYPEAERGHLMDKKYINEP